MNWRTGVKTGGENSKKKPNHAIVYFIIGEKNRCLYNFNHNVSATRSSRHIRQQNTQPLVDFFDKFLSVTPQNRPLTSPGMKRASQHSRGNETGSSAQWTCRV